jgi:hypothetical protein
MKRTRSYVTALVACGIALTTVSSATAQEVKQGTATVVRIKGQARYFTGNAQPQTLKVGMALKPGTVVQTAADAYVDIVLGETKAPERQPVFGTMAYQPEIEQNVVRIDQDSTLAIDKLTVSDTGADVVTDTQLDLRAGKIFGSVKKLSAASKYQVNIPNGVAGIRGTIYAISAVGVVDVLFGSVVLAWVRPDGTAATQVVPAGYQFDIRTGELTPIPRPLWLSIWRIIMDARVITTQAPVSPVDHTIYDISPTHASETPVLVPDSVGLAGVGK